MNLPSYLDEQGANYRLSFHPAIYTFQDLAQSEHISGKFVIKPVLIRADGEFMLCALPASYKIDLLELRSQLHCTEVELADESALLECFPDCDLGADPPIGRLWGMPTLMDESLITGNHVMFQAGTHEQSVSMTLAEY